MRCPNCNCPDEMDEVAYNNRRSYMCMDCDFVEKRTELAIDRTCPNCQSAPGAPCTQPTENSRRNVAWFHSARQNP